MRSIFSNNPAHIESLNLNLPHQRDFLLLCYSKSFVYKMLHFITMASLRHILMGRNSDYFQNYTQLAVGPVQTEWKVLPHMYGIFFRFCHIESLGNLKNIPTGYCKGDFLKKTVWVTKGGTRMGQFREIVAKAKRCIFLHIENEKLILGLYEEVYFSTFFKTLFI